MLMSSGADSPRAARGGAGGTAGGAMDTGCAEGEEGVPKNGERNGHRRCC